MPNTSIVPAEAVALMPDDLPAEEAAPLMCAGITVYNSLRNAGARSRRHSCRPRHRRTGASRHSVRPPDGISHSRHRPRRRQAGSRQETGAHEYIDTGAESSREALQKLGGAHVILATAPDSKSMSALVDGLGPNGTLMVIGAGIESLTVNPLQLILGSKAIRGWPLAQRETRRTHSNSAPSAGFAR